MKIDLNEIRLLRKKVIEAFLKSTGMHLIPTQSPDNPYYEDLNADIKDRLDLVNKHERAPGAFTFIKFFLNDTELDYDPKTIYLLEKYYLVCIGYLSGTSTLEKGVIKGCDIIDQDFITKEASSEQLFTNEDFYLSNQLCQWYGVVKEDNWDVLREGYQSILNMVSSSFGDDKSSQVSLVISGIRGSGKSTLLRRLSADCAKSGIVILWINDFAFFCKHLVLIEKEKKFLIVFDDWEKLKVDIFTINIFFSFIVKSKNIRIVISDIISPEKEYIQYFDEANIFHLLPSENNEILRNILDQNPDWKRTSEVFLSDPAFSYSPLYCCLFTIIESYSIKNKKQYNIGAVGLAHFKTIIRQGLQEINKSLPGLAEALYYLGCINSQYKLTISWDILLKLGDYLNGNIKISELLSDVNNKNEISDIISDYLSLTNGLDYKGREVFFIKFHSDLLAEYGLCQQINENWHFDNTIKIKIIELLIDKQSTCSAFILFLIFWGDKIGIELVKNYKEKNIESNLMELNMIFSSYYNLNKLCRVEGIITNDQFLKNAMFFLHLENFLSPINIWSFMKKAYRVLYDPNYPLSFGKIKLIFQALNFKNYILGYVNETMNDNSFTIDIDKKLNLWYSARNLPLY